MRFENTENSGVRGKLKLLDTLDNSDILEKSENKMVGGEAERGFVLRWIGMRGSRHWCGTHCNEGYIFPIGNVIFVLRFGNRISSKTQNRKMKRCQTPFSDT